MSPRTRRMALAVLVSLAAAGVALDGQDTGRPAPRPSATAATTAAPQAVVPRPSETQLNRQDRVSAAHRRRETRAFDDRPLLAVLPIELAGVRIDITGLAADRRTTELAIRPGPRGREYARALYLRALATYGDSGDAYTLRWAR